MKNDATLMLVTDRGVTDGCWRQIYIGDGFDPLIIQVILASGTNLIARDHMHKSCHRHQKMSPT